MLLEIILTLSQFFFAANTTHNNTSCTNPIQRYPRLRSSNRILIGRTKPYWGPSNPYSYLKFGAYPKIGLKVTALPQDYYTGKLGTFTYFYANEVFYKQVNDGEYEIIAPILGAQIPTLPKASRDVVYNGSHYQYYHGIYYIISKSQDNQATYTLVYPK